jgi:poly(3-hydroxyalkanoate) depolymerase
MVDVAGHRLRVATTAGNRGSVPLLVFNGLGANLELVRGFAGEIGKFGIGIVIFDVPGTGGSSAPALPYRFSWLARLANTLLTRLGIAGPVDVAGVSWGGGLAQEFTHCYPRRVRRLLLAATTAGAVALPGRPSALLKMAGIRRHVDRDYLARVGGELYGGKLRTDPKLLEQYGTLLRVPHGKGYYQQILATLGWTSVLWLPTLRQPTMVMMGTDDPIVPVANGRLLASLIPHGRLVTVPDGHLFLETSARECAPIVADFLSAGGWTHDGESVGRVATA